MPFNSFNFWHVFPLLFGLYWLIPSRFPSYKKWYLIIVSYLLYMNWKPAFAVVLLFVTGITFYGAKALSDASVHILLNINFSDVIGVEKYSSVFYGTSTKGLVDRNASEGRGGAIPSLGEIRNCHINVGTGKEISIRELAELVARSVGFDGTIEFDASKPDGTPRKLIDVSKLHSLGWTHKIEIEEGIQKLFDWYRHSIE